MDRFDVLVLLFLFMVGCVAGWFGELFFNRFFSSTNKGKWINPGFLQGPYLPIYGFGTVVLYCLSYLLNEFSLGHIVFDVILIFIVAAIIMDLLELIGGTFFIKVMNMRLWDYSAEPLNFKGIICLRFTLLWGFVSVLYYFLINPVLVKAVSLYTSNIEFSFIVGMFYGFILIDFAETMQLSTRIRKVAKKSDIIVTYKSLRSELSQSIENSKKSFFRLPEGKDIRDYLNSLNIKKTFEDEVKYRKNKDY